VRVKAAERREDNRQPLRLTPAGSAWTARWEGQPVKAGRSAAVGKPNHRHKSALPARPAGPPQKSEASIGAWTYGHWTRTTAPSYGGLREGGPLVTKRRSGGKDMGMARKG
jgi:hypothetical protein